MRLSLRDVLEMKQHNLKIPGAGIRINILEEIEPEAFIVQDETRVAILKVAQQYLNYVEVGKSLMVKPVKLNEFCIEHSHKKVSPQRGKLLKIDDPEEGIIKDLKLKFKNGQEKAKMKEAFTDKLRNLHGLIVTIACY